MDYVLAGHTHQPYTLQVNGTLIINPGSVGLNRDGDPRAAYAIIDGDTVELKRVEYPVGETITGVEEAVEDPTAREMLTDIYRGGPYIAEVVQEREYERQRDVTGTGSTSSRADTSRTMSPSPTASLP